MNKKIRLFLLILCIACFIIIAPILIAYSMGYRFDFETKKIVETGGIYVRTTPAADYILIDSKIMGKPGIFSNAFFVQSLLPKDHDILIKKNGYIDYNKKIPVKEKEVTKLENIILFKKQISVNPIKEKINFVSLAPDAYKFLTAKYKEGKIEFAYLKINQPQTEDVIILDNPGKILEANWNLDSKSALIKIKSLDKFHYYLFQVIETKPTLSLLFSSNEDFQKLSLNPTDPNEFFFLKNNEIYSLKNKKIKKLIENVIDYQLFNSNILWLSENGELLLSDFSGLLKEHLSQNQIIIKADRKYQLITINSEIFLKENNSLFLFNFQEKTWNNFESPLFEYEITPSPDNKKLMYCGKEGVYIYYSTEKELHSIFTPNTSKNCLWINNDYVIFGENDNIFLSEIDYRGNINRFNLNEIFFPNNNTDVFIIKDPQIFFLPFSGKLYIFTKETLWETEKILP